MTRPRTRRLALGIIPGLIIVMLVALAVSGAFSPKRTIRLNTLGTAGAGSVGAAPAKPPARICNNHKLLDGPKKAPKGAVSVPAGNNAHMFAYKLPANKTYYFAPGTHTVGSGKFAQIDPGNNDRFIGAPGAILSGEMRNDVAFGPTANNVKIEHLTIERFKAPANQGAITTRTGWTLSYNTVRNNLPGTGVYAGSHTVLSHNCLTRNGQQAFAAYTVTDTSSLTHGARDVVLSGNEISFNNTCNWEAFKHFPTKIPGACKGAGENSGCGCSGGGKFWATDNGTFLDNYVHNNYSVGMWADTNNTGFQIQGNYFANNLAEAIIYEISYNAVILDNTFIHNAVFTGPGNPGFPSGAVYVSESGGDSRVPGRYSGQFRISGNVFTNNWSGVVLWENANRYCSSSANTSTGDCTLVNRKVATLKTCANPRLLAKKPYYNDCRWQTKNVHVTGNVFRFTPHGVDKFCKESSGCGFNGVFSQYGTYKPYTAYRVPIAISDGQHNMFAHNSYYGPWHFDVFCQGIFVGWKQWTQGLTVGLGANKHVRGQEVGSKLNGST